MTTPQDADSSQYRPIWQLSFILRFSGATTSSIADSGASESTSSIADSDASASTSSIADSAPSASTISIGDSAPSASTSSTGDSAPSASTSTTGDSAPSASTSTGHGFVAPNAAASTSNGHGFVEPTAAAGNGFYGPAGAAAMLLSKDAAFLPETEYVLRRFRLGLGNQRIGVAEYRGLILGLTEALRKGLTEITVQTNSELVVNQFLGNWEIHDPELRALRDQALELRNSFHSFSINHIDQNLSRAVYDEAVRAISLPEGQLEEEPLPLPSP